MKVLEENFRFMVIEVAKQIENTLKVVAKPGSVDLEAIESRDDYIDNLKSVIENDCFSRIHGQHLDKRGVDRIRALNIVTSNLERLADHAVNVVRQLKHLSDPKFIHRYEYEPFFNEVLGALDKVNKAIIRQDMGLAFKICRSEFNLDSLYKSTFDRILMELKSGSDTGDLITCIFIFRYLERIGDALLNIGEACIFSITGEKFKIHQYTALRETLSAIGEEIPISDVEFESIWGTRSGCRIGKVQKGHAEGQAAQSLIFKEGSRKKLIQEKASIERWEAILPGLPPKVQALQEDGASVSLLIEYLGGCTLQDVVLTASDEIVKNALFLARQTITEVWESTLRREIASAHFMQQVRKRMPDVYRVHPQFQLPERRIGNLRVPSLEELLEEGSHICSRLDAPFSVFIHGDFNINNIVYNHELQRIHYIDLHRSEDSDYLQDVSVFLVSNFRLPVFDKTSRTKLNFVIRDFYDFARCFGRTHGDDLFEIRLAMGVMRSLITSTRFELNKRFARDMLNRGVFLLEHILEHARDKPLESFVMPLEVLTT